MKPDLNIAIVGLGNLGWNLGRRLHENGFRINSIVSRNPETDQSFSNRINATLLDRPEDLPSNTDLVFITTPDDALPRMVERISIDATLVHCSGSSPLFDREKSGVLYAFQTFTKFVPVEWETIPVFVESEDSDTSELLHYIAKKLSNLVQTVDSRQRKAIHISGVFGANFVNHILFQASKVLEKENIDFHVLEPLLHETLRKVMEHGPVGSQTGPAKRGDQGLIDNHLEWLQENPILAETYRMLSDQILKEYKK